MLFPNSEPRDILVAALAQHNSEMLKDITSKVCWLGLADVEEDIQFSVLKDVMQCYSPNPAPRDIF